MDYTVSETESEWDDEQYQLMTAFAEYESMVHGDCGHLLSESTSPLADPGNPDREYTYQAALPIRCHACTAINKKQAEYSGDNYDSARIWSAVRVPR